MGQREAVRQGACAERMPLTPEAFATNTSLFASRQSVPLCSDAVLHPPAGACGMRIAAHLRESLARRGWRQPIQEVA